MTIKKNLDITPFEKKQIRKWLDTRVSKLAADRVTSEYAEVAAYISDLRGVKNPLIEELRVYLLAFCEIIFVDGKFVLDAQFKYYLMAALEYFLEPEDIIPDYTPNVGFHDDVYAVNYVISKLNDNRKQEISNIVVRLNENKE